jgi:membrane-associated phospholipid phosphatase
MPFSFADFHYWPLLTRLGEMQLLVPAALIAIWRMHREVDARPLAAWWLLALALATLITTATKVAFIGWGVGSAWLNFTGISGHAMFAGAIFPVLMGAFTSHAKLWLQRSAVAAGFGLAALVGLSRSMVDAHSVSEIVAGLLLGGLASLSIILVHRLPRAVMGPRLAVVVALWLLAGMLSAPVSPTHSLVTRLALSMAGKAAPYTREDLLKEYGP